MMMPRQRFHIPLDASYVAGRSIAKRSNLPTSEVGLAAVLVHSLPLMLPAFLADATRHVRGIGPVSEVVATGSCQGSIERSGPFLISLGEPPHLVRGQARLVSTAQKGLPP